MTVSFSACISNGKAEYGVNCVVFQAKFLPHTGDCHIVTCARDGQVRLAQLSTTGTCKATKRLATHKMAAHKVLCQII